VGLVVEVALGGRLLGRLDVELIEIRRIQREHPQPDALELRVGLDVTVHHRHELLPGDVGEVEVPSLHLVPGLPGVLHGVVLVGVGGRGVPEHEPLEVIAVAEADGVLLSDEAAVRAADQHYLVEAEVLDQPLAVLCVLFVRVRFGQTRLAAAPVVVDH